MTSVKGTFKSAFEKLSNGIKDLSSLDVLTLEGSVTLTASDKISNFDELLTQAMKQTAADQDGVEGPGGNRTVDLRVIGSTRMMADGDITTFFDSEASEEKKEAHADLVIIANESRKATIEMIKDMLGDVAKGL